MTVQPHHHGPPVLALSTRGLAWLRILNIAYGAGIFAMLVVSAVAPDFLFAALGVAARGWEPATLSIRAIMIVGIVGALLAHRILTALLQMIDTVREGDPFIPDNAARLQRIAWLLLFAELLHLLVGALAQLASTPAQTFDIDWSFSFTPWIAVLLTFVLARVFAQGTRMREDLEGTV